MGGRSRIARPLGLVAALVVGAGCVPAAPIAAPVATSVASLARGGPFVIELAAAGVLRAGAPIDVRAEVSYDGTGNAVEILSPGSGPVVFTLRQVGGPIHLDGGGPADCASRELRKGMPFRTPFLKSGAIDPNDPAAEFYRKFVAEDDFRLPAGVWDVGAQLEVGLTGCADIRTLASTSVRLVIAD